MLQYSTSADCCLYVYSILCILLQPLPVSIAMAVATSLAGNVHMKWGCTTSALFSINVEVWTLRSPSFMWFESATVVNLTKDFFTAVLEGNIYAQYVNEMFCCSAKVVFTAGYFL